jgi:hypothetical protein
MRLGQPATTLQQKWLKKIAVSPRRQQKSRANRARLATKSKFNKQL